MSFEQAVCADCGGEVFTYYIDGPAHYVQCESCGTTGGVPTSEWDDL